MIKFERRKVRTKIKNPLLSFKVDTQEIEFRKDPLTGRWCRININRVKRLEVKKNKNAETIIKFSKLGCPFCEKNITSATPKFLELEERFRFGESLIFPNLYPYSIYHAVLVLSTKKHFIPLNKISSKLLFDGLKNCVNFISCVNKRKPQLKYPSLNLNFMPPAGASVVHPHFQLIIDDRPTFFTNQQIEKSLDYYKKEKSNFWLDLVEAEKKRKERYIGRIGSFSWIANFAPIKNNDVSGICTNGVSSLTELKEEDIKDLSNSLSKIFSNYWKMGTRSLTLSLFSGPIKRDISNYFALNLRIISRPIFLLGYTADIGFMELVHQENVVETLPEEVAKSLRFT